MKQWLALTLCGLLLVGLCSCGCNDGKVPTSSDQTTAIATTTTTTTGAMVVTDTSGSAVTDPDGSLVTTIVTGRPTATTGTDIYYPPFITVSTDAQGTTYTSVVPSDTTATTTTTTGTTTTTKPPTEQTINGIVLPANGYPGDDRVKIKSVSLDGNVVTMIIKNSSKVWETESGKSYFEYVCYDANSMALQSGRINFGYIPVSSETACTLTLPTGTAKLAITNFKAEYWTKPVK